MERQKIAPNRFFGTVVSWKSDFGWILPSEKISHPLASKRGGKLYVTSEDCDGWTLEEGQSVSFNIYKDTNGLGAMNCKAAGTFGGKPIFTQRPKAMASPPAGGSSLTQGGRKRIIQVRTQGQIKEKKGKIGFIKPKTPIKHPQYTQKGLYFHEDDLVPQGLAVTPGMDVTFFVYHDGKGIGAERIMQYTAPLQEPSKSKKEDPWDARSKGQIWMGPIEWAFAKEQMKTFMNQAWQGWEKPKPKKKLPRTRITGESVTGTVVSWKGTHGFITPDDVIDHPKASLKDGKIYVSASDVLTGELNVGDLVNFHVYEDKSGLGAEECIGC